MCVGADGSWKIAGGGAGMSVQYITINGGSSQSIQCIIEYQAYSPAYDLAPPPLLFCSLSPYSRLISPAYSF